MTKKITTGREATEQFTAEAARYGIAVTLESGGRRRFEVKCTRCRTTSDMYRGDFRDVEQIIQHYRKQGWVLEWDALPYCCTQCYRKADRAEKATRQREREIEMKDFPASPPPAQNVPSIGPDPKITRRVITLLNDHFNTDKRLYDAGWSDERVAKDANASLDFVTKYRREAYGELAENPAITQLRDDIKATQDLFSGQLQTLEKAFSQQLSELKMRLDKLIGHKAAG